MQLLLTVANNRDPYTQGLVENEPEKGPLLTLMTNQHFDVLVIVSTSYLNIYATELKNSVNKLYPNTSVAILDYPFKNLLDMISCENDIRELYHQVRDSYSRTSFNVNLDSLSPTLSVACLSLIRQNQIRAKALKIIDPALSIDGKRISCIAQSTRTGNKDKNRLEEPGELFIDDVAHQYGCIGNNAEFCEALDTAGNLSRHSIPILLQGETGVGKEVFARIIHRLSSRRNHPLVTVNCSTLPESIAESILFGHEKGAFPGAKQDMQGKIELADGGTLFLKHVDALPTKVQEKLKELLTRSTIKPMSSKKNIKVDIRLIASTQENLVEHISKGLFLKSFYKLLNAGEIYIPPLRKRKNDIPKLALFFLEKINSCLKTPKSISREGLQTLSNLSWQGNIRELQSVIERTALLCNSHLITTKELSSEGGAIETSFSNAPDLPVLDEYFSLEVYLRDLRKRIIYKALEQAKGNQSEAARMLKISPQAVHQFLKVSLSK